MANRGRPRSIQNVFSPVNSNTSFSEGQKSKGILDDFAVRKVINTTEGTIDATPTNAKDIVNKEYVDAQIAIAGDTNWWLSGGGILQPVTATDTISGANLIISGTISGGNVTTGSNPGHTHTLDNITNPEASKTFNLGNNKTITFSSVDTTPTEEEGVFNIEATGAFSGSLLHVHQHDGNPGATWLVDIEAEDSDVTPLRISAGAILTIDNSANLYTAGNISGANIITSGLVDGVDVSTLSSATTINISNISTLSTAIVAPLSGNFDALSAAYILHAADSSDPHGALLSQSNITSSVISGGSIYSTGDNTTLSIGIVRNIILGTDATPPTASDYTTGTIYVQYTP